MVIAPIAPRRLAFLAFISLLAQGNAIAQPAAGPTAAVIAEVDKVFARWDSTSLPGCTVGVSRDGRPFLARAYGMADLEHGVANRPDSVIEAGSVSKQFTAAAVLLLVQQGKVALDDPARKYIPEIPDYGTPLTVRHLLTHTSGLRDWGSIEAIVGWPRTSRAYTHAHVLDIVSRQRSLNFPPGSAYSYSNTGYNLAAILVSRVSGKSFADFTREMLFEPLGMTRTSWRDDFTRVVPDRSIAYDVGASGAVSMDMPFENVHGNGGLLTTVSDLLRWNENAVHAKVGGRGLVDLQRETMRLTNGEKIEYAFGLRISSWRGVPEVAHSGSTAGYRAWLGQYPTKQISVAVLCNAANAPATGLGHQVADLFLDLKNPAPVADPGVTVAESGLREVAGLYRDRRRNDVVAVEFKDGALRIEGAGVLRPVSKDAFQAGGARLDLERDAGGSVRGMRVASGGEVIAFDRVQPASPTAAELAPLAGEYTSDEAELTLRVTVEDGRLVIHRRPDTRIVLSPTFADGFAGELGGVLFLRGPKGLVTGMSVSVDRVWDLRFTRAPITGKR
ncbi:MAG: beta-lactamase family protein [Vicinamibacteria bacterium]|nr:beta-lactamase family protein [Vicinamibacteria bacterium]